MSGRLEQIEQRARDYLRVGRVTYGGETALARDVLLLVEIAKAAQRAWDADERSAGAWTATEERAVKDLAAALDDIGSALARLDATATEQERA